MGTGVLNNGIYFLAESRYGFGRAENFGLGLLLGVLYVPSALLAGRLVRWLERWISARSVLGVVIGLISVLCLLPWGAEAAWPGGRAQSWTMWVVAGAYALLTGALWPMLESFVSGGRSGRALRAAVGRFNVTWASALVVVFWLIAPWVKERALEALAVTGALHVASLAVLAWLPRSPGAHGESHEPHPDVYDRLLRCFRVLLLMTYTVKSTLLPALPAILEGVGVAKSWGTPAASAWLIARVATFFALERWHGWRGSWAAPVAGSAMLVFGFAATLLVSSQGPSSGAVAGVVASLVVFGVGAGVIYSAALYYAMAVGRAEVDAGGTHEALIGVGYSSGPLIGLAALGTVSWGVIPPSWFEGALVAVVSVGCAGFLGIALWDARRAPNGKSR